jgi:site-specific DNA-methyltransferase (adenine-specific)
MAEPLPPLPLDQILCGDCRQVLAGLPEQSVDVVFADPPYNLQLRQELHRPDHSRVDGVDDDWDQFDDFAQYDRFSREWLSACRRVLKPTGTLWVIGSYHNIYRLGALLQDLNFWILNDIIWIKANPMPNFRGVRFTNAHETLLWAQKERGASYVFNHRELKAINDDLQMRSDWWLPLCTGKERLRENGVKVHATQKPEALLYRVILASTLPGDVILDPFFGTGTTGVAAKRLGRHWLGIEQDPAYIAAAQKRIDATPAAPPESIQVSNPRSQGRIPFGTLLEYGLLQSGQTLYFGMKGEQKALLLADGNLQLDGHRGSIHEMARLLQPGAVNGWNVWYYDDPHSGIRQQVDVLRQRLRIQLKSPEEKE